MFGNNKTEKEAAELANKKNQIEKGTKITGDIESHGNIRFDGEMIGNVTSHSKVVLGESSVMDGKLVAQNAEISGEIKGTIEVSDLLILKETERIHELEQDSHFYFFYLFVLCFPCLTGS